MALAGCGSDDGEPRQAPTTATTTSQEFAFTGYVFRVEGETKICDAILESYPPQCGGESYRVAGLDVSGVDGVKQDQGVAWTEQPVTIQGVLSDDGQTLVVSPKQGGRIEIPPPTAAEQPGNAPG